MKVVYLCKRKHTKTLTYVQITSKNSFGVNEMLHNEQYISNRQCSKNILYMNCGGFFMLSWNYFWAIAIFLMSFSKYFQASG